MNRILSLIRFVISTAFPNQQPPPPTIESYGQNLSGMSDQQIQPIMEWLFLSLIKAGYSDRAHLIWYNDADPDPDLRQAMKEALQLEEPMFLYRCGSRTFPPLDGYYWRMMPEHPSTRIYLLSGQR